MTEQKSQPVPTGAGFGEQPHAYNPVTQPQLFDAVIRKRCVAFIIDAIIILILTAVAGIAVLVLGVLTLGLAWLLFGLVFPAVGLGYNAVTIGGPNAATIQLMPQPMIRTVSTKGRTTSEPANRLPMMLVCQSRLRNVGMARAVTVN